MITRKHDCQDCKHSWPDKDPGEIVIMVTISRTNGDMIYQARVDPDWGLEIQFAHGQQLIRPGGRIYYGLTVIHR